MSTTTGTYSKGIDEPAFATFFRTYYSLANRTAYRVVRKSQDAEDVVQTVFLNVVRREETELAENVKGYLCRAAVYEALRLIRSRGQQPVSGDVEQQAALSESILEEQTRETLRTAVGMLQP